MAGAALNEGGGDGARLGRRWKSLRHPDHALESWGTLAVTPYRRTEPKMAQSIATYIALPGTTAEAMQHWHEVFGGELKIQRYRDVPSEGMPFEPDPDAVAHATLVTSAGTIAGGDAMDDGTDYPVRGSAYSMLVTTETAEEARDYIKRLRDGGGDVGMPFEKAPWGDWYGQVFDRFGVMWAFSCAEE